MANVFVDRTIFDNGRSIQRGIYSGEILNTRILFGFLGSFTEPEQ